MKSQISRRWRTKEEWWGEVDMEEGEEEIDT